MKQMEGSSTLMEEMQGLIIRLQHPVPGFIDLLLFHFISKWMEPISFLMVIGFINYNPGKLQSARCKV